MQISKPLNIGLSLPLLPACASAAEGRQRAALQTVSADEISAPAVPCLQASEHAHRAGPFGKLTIDVGYVCGRRRREEDEASG